MNDTTYIAPDATRGGKCKQVEISSKDYIVKLQRKREMNK